MNKQKLIQYHKNRTPIIKHRISEFNYLWGNASEKRLFSELCFCLCTPQSKAKLAHQAILKLKKNNLLIHGSTKQIREHLSGVRFPNNKAKYIFEAEIKSIDTESIVKYNK